MPKIIQNVRRQLLEETKRQIETRGYTATTIRSVAGACGVGVGTVYNYFPSKDMLIASFMLEDWQLCLAQMKNGESENVLRRIYDALQGYVKKHQTLFQDKDAAKVFATVFTERHKQLRAHIAEIVLPLCKNANAKDTAFLSEFIAEALLTWIVAGKSFEDIAEIIRVLLK